MTPYLVALFCFVVSFVIDPLLKYEQMAFVLFGWFFIGMGFCYERKWRKS